MRHALVSKLLFIILIATTVLFLNSLFLVYHFLSFRLLHNQPLANLWDQYMNFKMFCLYAQCWDCYSIMKKIIVMLWMAYLCNDWSILSASCVTKVHNYSADIWLWVKGIARYSRENRLSKLSLKKEFISDLMKTT